jgi:hypothetical protein
MANSDLNHLLSDAEEKFKLGRMAHVVNHEDDVAVIKDMNSKITYFMNLYLVSHFQFFSHHY